MPEVVTPAHATRRPHIQGLRAIAVLLVVAGHAFEVPVGGFLGVDMFFVVSGFVITLSLLREAERDGVVSLRAFVIRRLGRLFPAGALVVVVTVVVGAVVFFVPRATQIAMDGLASVLSVENWRAARLGTDYFAGFAQASPLQHYWSLSVEEQFYAVWPLTFALCALAGWPRLRRWAGIIAAAATVSSFAIAMVESAQRPAWAYFSFESRAWELGVGVVLAIALFRLRVRPAISTALAVAGAVAVAAGVVLVDGQTGFPAPAALPVVLGTAALIAAGETTSPARVLAPLRVRSLTFVGDISYSLYLWHYPLLIVATALWPGAVGIWVSLALLGPFAYVSYRFVEVPFRDRAGRVADRGSRGLHLRWGVATLGIVGALSLTQLAGPSSWIETPQLTPDATERAPFATQALLRDSIERALLAPDAPLDALDTAWPSASAAQFAARGGMPDASRRPHRGAGRVVADLRVRGLSRLPDARRHRRLRRRELAPRHRRGCRIVVARRRGNDPKLSAVRRDGVRPVRPRGLRRGVRCGTRRGPRPRRSPRSAADRPERRSGVVRAAERRAWVEGRVRTMAGRRADDDRELDDQNGCPDRHPVVAAGDDTCAVVRDAPDRNAVVRATAERGLVGEDGGGISGRRRHLHRLHRHARLVLPRRSVPRGHRRHSRARRRRPPDEHVLVATLGSPR